ncbi:hypothetical protein RintRC_4791 [Richelia intracellularis]|nr:hypothetical protein RintRC_4791 [Richelia intracellularis]
MFNSPFAIGELQYFYGTTSLGTNVDGVPLLFDFAINRVESLGE